MQTCATMCYSDLEKTNHTVTERLNERDLSFNENSYARTFKCLAVFQTDVIEYMNSSWAKRYFVTRFLRELEFNKVDFVAITTISMWEIWLFVISWFILFCILVQIVLKDLVNFLAILAKLFNVTKDSYFFAFAVLVIAIWEDNENMTDICWI